MTKGLRDATESISVGRRGRPREFFRIKPGERDITVAGIRTPDRERGRSVAAFVHSSPVWILKSRAEANRIITDLEKARDIVFPETGGDNGDSHG